MTELKSPNMLPNHYSAEFYGQHLELKYVPSNEVWHHTQAVVLQANHFPIKIILFKIILRKSSI